MGSQYRLTAVLVVASAVTGCRPEGDMGDGVVKLPMSVDLHLLGTQGDSPPGSKWHDEARVGFDCNLIALTGFPQEFARSTITTLCPTDVDLDEAVPTGTFTLQMIDPDHQGEMTIFDAWVAVQFDLGESAGEAAYGRDDYHLSK